MATVLFAHGSPDHARRVFREQGHGYWSAALPLVFEKHGILDVEPACGPRALWGNGARPAIVACLGEEAWGPEAVTAFMARQAPSLLEGPLPPALEVALGLRRADVNGLEADIAVVDERVAARAACYGAMGGGPLRLPLSREVVRPPALEWQSLTNVPTDAEQADAWRAPGWRMSAWDEVGDAVVLARLGDARGPAAIVRVGHVVACSFGLFGYLGQAHTSEPFPAGQHRSSPRTLGLETLLLALLDDLHAGAGLTRARILPWPDGRRWAMNIRHDFDRPLGVAAVAGVLDRHDAVGTAATWYWRSRHLQGRAGRVGRRALERVAWAPAHEIALHAERLWVGSGERAVIEAAAGARVLGSSAHGDPSCTRFQGAPNVLWAAREGLAYTELLQHAHLHPHRFATLEHDGVVSSRDVICLPHHESFDRSAAGGDVGADRLDGISERWSVAGGMLQVLNHPDINLDSLFEALARVPRDGRLDWTAVQAVDWWRRTHVSAELIVRRWGPADFEVVSRMGVRSLAMELRNPVGEERVVVLDLEPGRPARVTHLGVTAEAGGVADSPGVLAAGTVVGARAEARRRWREDFVPRVDAALRAWYARRGDAGSAAALTTIRTNTDLVPDRWDGVVTMIEHGGGMATVEGLRILEAGCGFGALAAFAALSGARSVTGVDMSESYLDVARAFADPVDGLALRFEHADIRRLGDIPDGAIDLVVANNALLYLREREQLRDGLCELRRVLTPGGRIVIHQANRLRVRDPFTGTPLAHLLPGALTRLGGGASSRDRVMLLSPRGLRSAVRRAGFVDARSGALRAGHGVHTGMTHNAARFVFVTARRPT